MTVVLRRLSALAVVAIGILAACLPAAAAAQEVEEDRTVSDAG